MHNAIENTNVYNESVNPMTEGLIFNHNKLRIPWLSTGKTVTGSGNPIIEETRILWKSSEIIDLNPITIVVNISAIKNGLVGYSFWYDDDYRTDPCEQYKIMLNRLSSILGKPKTQNTYKGYDREYGFSQWEVNRISVDLVVAERFVEWCQCDVHYKMSPNESLKEKMRHLRWLTKFLPWH